MRFRLEASHFFRRFLWINFSTSLRFAIRISFKNVWSPIQMSFDLEKNVLHKAIGTSLFRSESYDKVTGIAQYVGDRTPKDLLHARLVLSPYAHARIQKIDTSSALKSPGVKAVYTNHSLSIHVTKVGSRKQTPLADEEVVWCGQPVAIVLAETEAAAEDGVALVDIDYEPLPVVIDPLIAMIAGTPLTCETLSTHKIVSQTSTYLALTEEIRQKNDDTELSENVSDRVIFQGGDMEVGWHEAEYTLERTYTTSCVHQSYLEPQSVLVVPDKPGRSLTIWSSTQGILAVRSDVAKAVNIPEQNIHVEVVPVGGSFGGKFCLMEPLVAAAALAIKKPVRLIYTRQDDLLAGNPAPQSIISIKLGAKKDGTLTALQGKIIFDTGAHANSEVILSGLTLGNSYRCSNYNIRCYEVMTNKVGVGSYRAPGGPQATFAIETAIDELCLLLALDPLEFRLKNAVIEGDSTLDRHQWPRIGFIECLQEAKKHPLWTERCKKNFEAPPASKNWNIGIGLASGGWLGGTAPTAAACKLEADGTVTVLVGTVDLTGTDTSFALLAAEAIGISPNLVHVVHSNTDTMPYTGGTGASKTTYSMGPAVLAAAQDVRNQILTIASDLLEAKQNDLEIAENQVVVLGSPTKNISLRKIASASTKFAGRHKPIYGSGLAAISERAPMFATHLVKVAVDVETGEIHILDYVAIHDVGCAINPSLIKAQIHGGVVQGIGMALFEKIVFDENGQPLITTFMDYALPRAQDVPNITTILLEVPSIHGPFGARGIGEPPIVPVSAAIANAIYDAVGVRATQLPITSEAVFNAMNR